jgi:hypothetical protein
MHNVAEILGAIEQGDTRAADQLISLVCQALRELAAVKLAQEAPGQISQATALVHEAYPNRLSEKRSNEARITDGWAGKAPHWRLVRRIVQVRL